MDEAEPPPQRRPTSPWLFLPLLVPFGTTSAQALIAFPYLLRVRDDIPMDRIAALTALTYLPHSWKFLWTPIIDLLIRRKYWHIYSSLVATVGTLLAFLIPARTHFGLLSAVLLLVNFAAATSHNALGSLCATTVEPHRKGLASGCFSAGQLAAQGLVGGLILLLAEPPRWLGQVMRPLSMGEIGALVTVLMVATTLVGLAVDEAPPVKRPVLPLLRAVLKDTGRVVRSRVGWTGLLICLSPVGAAAASNLFGALAGDFHASTAEVLLATGLIAGLANSAGALLGGWMADRMNRRVAYVLGGALTAACAVAMAICPPLPFQYVIWTLGYAVASGISYATFYAFVFEMIGPTEGATTTYGLFAGAGNVAIAYVTYFDGLMYAHGGRAGLLGCDAALTVLGIGMLGVMVHLLRRREGLPATA